MEKETPKQEKLIERIRNRQKSANDKKLWKIRLLFLAPFLIAAAVFLLMSLGK